MSPRVSLLALSMLLVVAACDDNNPNSLSPTSLDDTRMTFFVSSAKSVTGNLGGIRGADTICQNLAGAAGAGERQWRAYLSSDRDPANGLPIHARNRIGAGPWFNANGTLVAADINDLHTRPGDAALLIDERGERIPGQWPGSPSPVEHDILTGSTQDGMLLPGSTCRDWTSASADDVAQVGHSDGLGPGGNTTGTLSSWNSAHANQNCANTAPRGGAGRIYCFARN